MISSNVFRFLAVAGALCLGTLPAPAQAAVFQASTTVSLFEPFQAPYSATFLLSLPQYSGPGRIVGVNIEFTGSASAADIYDYMPAEGITVASYSRTWSFGLVGPPNIYTGSPFLDVDVTAEYQGGSIPPCPGGGGTCGFPQFLIAAAGPAAFSGSVDVADFSDYAGSGSNAFLFVASNLGDTIEGSATVTETITAVPEPSTWAMAFIGFAIVGFAAHRGRLARLLAGASVLRTRPFS